MNDLTHNQEGPESVNGDEVPNELEMAPDLMLDLARQSAELLVERMQGLPEENAWDGDFRGSLEPVLMEEPPEEGNAPNEVIERVAREVLPFAMRLDHPRCFAFVPSAPTWPGVLADFIASGFNFNVCTWLVASGPSQLELVVIDWFRRWVGYPEGAGGLLTSGGSAAALNAFVAAREAAGNPERPTVYMSDQSHSAQVRSARIIGVRPECIRSVPIDKTFRLDMNALARAVADDRAAGFSPMVVCANAGATGNGAIDPLEEMADFCETEGIWLHADASYGGFAVLTAEGRKLLRGIERSDSIALDGHKWLFQPYEIGGLLVKDLRTLETPFSVQHDVLQDTVWGETHPNFSDRSLQLSRGFRALKVWMSIQTFGVAAFRRAISRSMVLAARAGKLVRKSSVLELLAPVSPGVVCFRINPEGPSLEEKDLYEINRTVLARVLWEDRALMSSTVVEDQFSLRLCIINHNTTWNDVRETLEFIERTGREELSKIS